MELLYVPSMADHKISVDAILLAAGSSTRLGSSKQLLPIQGKPLLKRTAETLLASDIDNLTIVLGASADEHMMIIEMLPIRTVINKEWERGIGSSIRKGMETAMEENPDAVLIAVCDQPFLSTNLVNRFIQTFHSTGSELIASSYQGTLGTPALFARRLFKEIAGLPDGHGARKLFELHRDIDQIPFPLGGIDIDTGQDYLKVKQVLNF